MLHNYSPSSADIDFHISRTQDTFLLFEFRLCCKDSAKPCSFSAANYSLKLNKAAAHGIG